MDTSLGLDQQYPPIQPIGAPSDGLPSQSLGLADPTTGIGDFSGVPVARANMPIANTPSLGLDKSRTQSDQDYLRNLPTGEKIGLMMKEFAAGVAGRESPIDGLLKQKRQKEMQGMQDLTNTLTLIKTGTEIVRKLPQGSMQRNAVLAELGKVAPHLAPVFAAAGSENDDAIKNYLDVMGDPEVKQMAVKQCSQNADFNGCILTLSKDNDWSKRAELVVDNKRISGITTKLRAVSDSMKAEGKPTFSLADIESLNAGNKVFSFEEMQTIRRKEKELAPLGLITTAVQQAGDIAREQATVKSLTEAKLPVEKLIEARDRMKKANPADPNIRIIEQAITHAVNPQSQKIIIPPQPVAPQMVKNAEGVFQVDRNGASKRVMNPDGTPMTGKETADRVIPAPIVKAYTENSTALRKIDSALSEVKKYPDAFGLGNVVGDAVTQRTDPKGVVPRALIADIGSLKIHDRSGAAVTASETPRLLPFIPNVSDKAETIVKKLNLFRTEYEAIQRDISSIYGADQGYKPFPATKGKTSGTSDYVETRKTKDGRMLGKKADGTIEEIK